MCCTKGWKAFAQEIKVGHTEVGIYHPDDASRIGLGKIARIVMRMFHNPTCSGSALLARKSCRMGSIEPMVRAAELSELVKPLHLLFPLGCVCVCVRVY